MELAVVKVVTELFIMVLCVTAAPVDQQEIRVDFVSDRGYAETMIVQRAETGFNVYNEMDGSLVEVMNVVPKQGADHVFVCTDREGNKETVDLAQGIIDFSAPKLKKETRLRLKARDGVKIAINRSDDVVFITPDKLRKTYVVH